MASKEDKARAEELVAESVKLIEAKDWQGLIALMDEAIRLDPENADAWNNRGSAKSELGQHIEAIKDFDKAIELNKNNAFAWNNRGLSKTHLGQLEDAIKDFDRAIKIKNDFYDAWKNRGFAKGALGQHIEAIKDFDKAIDLDENNAVAWKNRGNIKLELRRHIEAIEDFNKFIELNENDAIVWNNLATAQAHLGKFDEALKSVEKAVKLDPENAAIRNNQVAIRAEKDARDAIEERIGKVDKSKDTIRNERKALEDRYQKQLCARNIMAICLIFVIVAAIIAPIILLILILCGYRICNKYFCVTDLTLDFTLLYFWSFVIFSLSAPLLIFLKLLSRDAEETKILSHDYLRMQMIEDKFNLAQPFLGTDTDKREIFEKQLDNWMHNSPTSTLLKIKYRHTDKSACHPIEEALEKVLEKCKQMMGKAEKGKDKS